MSQATGNLVQFEKVLQRYSHGRWSDEEQRQILLGCIACFVQAEQLDTYLAGVVQEANTRQAANYIDPALQQQQAAIDANLTRTILQSLQAVDNFTVQSVDGVIAIDATVEAESYTQITNWLTLETPLPGFDPEGEVIFGYLIDVGEFKAIVALTNSPYGPWIDAWIQTNTTGMELSPPPLGQLGQPIIFTRPSGKVVLTLKSAG